MSLASDLVTDIRKLTNDQVAPHRHSDGDLINWISSAQRSVVTLRPDANTKLVEIEPVVDSVEQDVSSVGHLLVDVVSNSTTGQTIRRTDLATLDDFTPEWRVEDPSDSPESWANNVASATAFWIYPKPDATVKLHVLVTQTPAKLTALSDALVISGTFDSAIINHVLSRVLEIDNDREGSILAHQKYATELGVQSQVQREAKA